MTPVPSSLLMRQRIDLDALAAAIQERFPAGVSLSRETAGVSLSIALGERSILPSVCKFLFWDSACSFGGIVVEERATNWRISYLFLATGSGWIEVVLQMPTAESVIPTVSSEVHAADWHEREAEDLFGLQFEGHPRLGDFILHDQIWSEGLAPHRKPHRKLMDAHEFRLRRRANSEWRPVLVVRDPGAFAMPVGPVYEGGVGESLHFLLETVGEDVVRAVPRLFYNFRGLEKIAEGRAASDVLLLAERFAATSAFAHSLAFSRAVETLCGVEVPARSKHLRVLLAELERLRHHTGAITGICESTALAVAASQAAIVEEQLLRASCRLTGHRYLFGLNTPGGLRRDFTRDELRDLLASADSAVHELQVLEKRLRLTSSFLDRLEDVGVIEPEKARDLNLLGPVGRASGRCHDLRRESSYGGYDEFAFEVPRETEGDGYARLRVLFGEAYQSAKLIRQAVERLQPGPVLAACEPRLSGAAVGWAEAPIGATLHWVRLDEAGTVERYRVITPSFNNWLGFHVAVEDFAFQDFPIILATFGLSATECDR
jgi:formate hydrogenlyase subunit 5